MILDVWFVDREQVRLIDCRVLGSWDTQLWRRIMLFFWVSTCFCQVFCGMPQIIATCLVVCKDGFALFFAVYHYFEPMFLVYIAFSTHFFSYILCFCIFFAASVELLRFVFLHNCEINDRNFAGLQDWKIRLGEKCHFKVPNL